MTLTRSNCTSWQKVQNHVKLTRLLMHCLSVVSVLLTSEKSTHKKHVNNAQTMCQIKLSIKDCIPSCVYSLANQLIE